METKIKIELGRIYHIFNHGNGEDNLFLKEKDYHKFIYLLEKYLLPYMTVEAYCLMPNHFHFLIKVYESDKIDKHLKIIRMDNKYHIDKEKLINQQLSNFFNAYTKYLNYSYERKGSLFRKTFKRKLVDNEEYHFELINYIYNNPVKHGFVKHPELWKFTFVANYFKSIITNQPSRFKP